MIRFNSLKKYPPNKSLLLRLIKTYAESGDTESAIKWCEMCVGMNDMHLDIVINDVENWLPHQYMSNLYFAVGDYKNALKHNEILIKKFPEAKGYKENNKQIKAKINSKKKVLIL